MMRYLKVFIYISLNYIGALSYAQFYTGPVAASMGGAGRGAADEAEQALLNPATLVHSSTFTSSLIYSDGYFSKDEHERTLGLTLSDNSSDILFPGSYAYINKRSMLHNYNAIDQEYHQVSMAKFIFSHLSIGAAVTLLRTSIEGGRKYEHWDGNLGLHYNPIPDLGIGLVFYNVGPLSEKAPREIETFDKIALGFHYIIMPTFRLRLDVLQNQYENPNHRNEIQLGFESRISEFMVFRAGLDNNPYEHRNYYSAGFGFDGPRLKIDYSYRKNSDYNDGAMHGVDMRMPFW